MGNNPDWKREVNQGKRNNQNFGKIPLGKFIQQITYKLQAQGIEVVVAEESYTSKASFLDWDNIPTDNPQVKLKPSFSGKRVGRALYLIVTRNRGTLVVQPRRITPVFPSPYGGARSLLKALVGCQTP